MAGRGRGRRTQGRRASYSLGDLVGDVRCLEGGEDEDVRERRATCESRRLSRCDARVDGYVELDLALDEKVGAGVRAAAGWPPGRA